MGDRVWVVARKNRGFRPSSHEDQDCQALRKVDPGQVKNISRESAARAGYPPCRYCCVRGVVRVG